MKTRFNKVNAKTASLIPPIKISRIKANGTLSIQLTNKLYLALSEGYFLSQNTASEHLDNERANYSINDRYTTSSNINFNNSSISEGIKIKLQTTSSCTNSPTNSQSIIKYINKYFP